MFSRKLLALRWTTYIFHTKLITVWWLCCYLKSWIFAEPEWDTVTGLGTMLHTTNLQVFAGTCRKGCKTNTRGPLRKDIPNAFPGMTGESGRVLGIYFQVRKRGWKIPPPLCVSTCEICDSVIPHNEGIRGRFFTEVWMLMDHSSSIGRSCWALYKSQFPQLRSASHLAASPHTGGDQIVQMRRGLEASVRSG